MRRHLLSTIVAIFAGFGAPTDAATLDLTPDYANPSSPFASQALLDTLTDKGQRATSLLFEIQTHVSAYAATGPSFGLTLGDTVTFSALYRMTPAGAGNLRTFMRMDVSDGNGNGVIYFDAAIYDAMAHQIVFINNEGTSAYSIDASACGLTAGASLLALGTTAQSGCATFSGGQVEHSNLVLASAPATVNATLAAVPVPALGFAYGLVLLGGAGVVAGRRRQRT